MSASSYISKAVSYHRSAQLELALKNYKKALKISPSNITALNGAGAITMALGNPREAISFFEATLKSNTNDIVALGSIGVAYQQLDMPHEAIQYYERILASSPDNVTAHLNIALAQLETGNRNDAVEHCDKIISIDPNLAATYIIKGNALTLMGQFELSIEQYQIALRLDAENVQSITGLVNSHIKLGNRHAATALLQSHKDSRHPDLLVSLAAIAEADERSNIASRIIDVINADQLTTQQTIQLCFSVGNLLDKDGDFDKAFKYYSMGNSCVSRSYAPADDDAFTREIIQKYRPDCILSEESPPSRKLTGSDLIFLIGMPRSGTSLLEKMLGAHTDIRQIGERSTIPNIANNLSQTQSYPESLALLSTLNINEQRSHYYKDIESYIGKYRYITDKLPHNFLYLGLIKVLFPDCIILHCVRNAYDTCISNYMQYFSSPLSYPYSMENIAHHYNNYRKIMSFWKDQGIEIQDIHYENVVNKTETELSGIFNLLGLEYQQQCLKFYQNDSITRTASAEQVSNPLYTSSIGKWKHYESHLTPLFDIIGHPSQ